VKKGDEVEAFDFFSAMETSGSRLQSLTFLACCSYSFSAGLMRKVIEHIYPLYMGTLAQDFKIGDYYSV